MLAGGAAASAGGYALWGRYAVGDTFEQHVAGQLGLPVRVTSELLDTMRADLGDVDYDARASAFMLATTSPSGDVMPHKARREAVEAFIGPLMKVENSFVTPFVLAGLQDTGRYRPCVLRRDATD